MGTLMDRTPKALLQVAGKTLLEHKLDVMPNDVDEIIIVVGYLGGMIRKHFGNSYHGRRLLYVEEDNPVGGTAHSLWKAQSVLKNKFLVMNGDNIYSGRDIEECAKCVEKDEWAVLVQKKERVLTGRVIADENGYVTDILENNLHENAAGYANTGLYALDMRIFSYTPVSKSPGSSELGLPQTIVQVAKNISIRAIPATFWIEIKMPEDLKTAEKTLKRFAK